MSELRTTDNVFNFDKTAAVIAALHSSDIKRSICHEQIVRALRDVWNAACILNHCTIPERELINAALEWYNKQNEKNWTIFINTLDTADLASRGTDPKMWR